MKVNQILVREDGQEFEAVEINHWSLVVSHRAGVNGYSEDRIKFLGMNNGKEEFVGHSSGYSYLLQDRFTE